MEQGAKPEQEAEGEEVEIVVKNKQKQAQCKMIQQKDQREMDEGENEEEDEELLGLPHSSDDSDDKEGKEHQDEEQHAQENSKENVLEEANNGDNHIEKNHDCHHKSQIYYDDDIFLNYSSKGLCYYKEDLPILEQEIKLANHQVSQHKPIKIPDNLQQFQQLLDSNFSSLKHTIEQQELSRKNNYKNGKQSNLNSHKKYGYSGNTANKYVSSRKRRLHGDPDFESLGFVASNDADDGGEDYDDDNEENNQENSQDQEEEEEEEGDGDGEEEDNNNDDRQDENNHNINNTNAAAIDGLERNNTNNNTLNKPFIAQSSKKYRQNNDPQNHHEDKTDLDDDSQVAGAQSQQKSYYSSMQHSKSVPSKAHTQSHKSKKELQRKTQNNFTNFKESHANSQLHSTEYPEPAKKKKLKTEGSNSNNNNNSASSASSAVLNKESKQPKKKQPQHSQSQDHSDEDYDDVEVTISDEQQHELLRYHKRSKNYFGTAKQFNISHQQARAIVKIHKVEFKNLPSY